MKVRLDLTVSNNALPALIIIRGFSGRLVLYKRLNGGKNSLCFSARERNLIITVRPFNACYPEKSYFIKFGCKICYRLRLDFIFTPKVVVSEQRFCLYDEFYRFPISSAVLEFEN
ncbi:MAG: hypothetical protein J5911_04660 [Clostridia bacterium]|nr:hypothetical protein [Clostridia bacterium]